MEYSNHRLEKVAVTQVNGNLATFLSALPFPMTALDIKVQSGRGGRNFNAYFRGVHVGFYDGEFYRGYIYPASQSLILKNWLRKKLQTFAWQAVAIASVVFAVTVLAQITHF